MYVPVQYHRANDWLCFTAGSLFNGAFLWLLAKRTEPEMAPYRPILVFSAVRNLIYLAVIAVVVPVLPIDRGSNSLISVGLLGWVPQPYNFALVFTWTFLFVFALVSQWVPFVYRYAILCLKKEKYGLREYLAMLTCPVAITVGHVAICYHIGYIPGEFGDTEQQRIIELFYNGTTTPLFVPFFIDEVRTLKIAPYIGTWVILSYTLVLVFGWRIYRHLKRQSTTNLSEERAHEINLQVSRALTLLALLPLVVETVPTTWLVGGLLVGLPMGNTSAYITAIFAWAPVIDPLITAWVVRSYRREVCGWLKRWLLCKGDTNTSAVETFHPSNKPML